MSITLQNGRLGNQIIRNLAVSMIAEKYNLYVKYSSHNIINNLGIRLFVGENNYKKTVLLSDDNYFTILDQIEPLDANVNPNHNFFQTQEITNFLYNYLHTDNIKTQIIDKNPYKDKYRNNNDVHIHIRLTDAVNWNPGIQYYKKALSEINYENAYISTDEKEHSMIKELTNSFPNIKILEYDEVGTIQFASTCKHNILSHGSFSAVIGYLAFYSDIYYPEYESNKIWYGDMFSINGWKKINIH